MAKQCAATEHPEGKLLTVAEAAQRLRICRSKMYGLVDAGEIRHLRIGKSVRISECAVEVFKDKCTLGG